MGKPQDKNATGGERRAKDAGRAGHVEVDARGRNVWRWAREGIDSTSVLLKGLENKDLALEPTQKVPVVPADDPRAKTTGGRPADARALPATPGTKNEPAAKRSAAKRSAGKGAQGPARNEARRDRGGGFDPYNSR
jgi:hypothetical protein